MKIYKCYSRKLKEFLEDNGEDVIVKALDIDNSKTMWVFQKNISLSKLLSKWTNEKS